MGLIVMNKIIKNDEKIVLTCDSEFTIFDDVSVKIYVSGGYNILFNVGKNSNVIVFHCNMDSNSNVSIHMVGDYGNIEYYYSMINYGDHFINIDVFHEGCNTTSNVFCNAVNVDDKKLSFNVNGKVFKDVYKCNCNQSSKIVNMNNGHSIICPNLLIDCYDVLSSHSAYIGKFDLDLIFYLMSRGICYDKCINMLLSAFLIPDFVEREKIDDFISKIDEIKR